MKELALIIPHTDTTLERDLRRFLPKEYILHTQRIWLEAVSEAAEKHMVSVELPKSIDYLSGITNYDGAIFGCTSASAVYGKTGLQNLEKLLRDSFACPGISAFGAVLEKLAAVNSNTIALFTPYTNVVNQMMKKSMDSFGINTLVCFGMGLTDDLAIAQVNPETIESFVRNHMDQLPPEIETIFISCTNLRAFEIKDTIASMTGLPTITSNSAIVDWIENL
jgi:maleate isomerase